MSHPNSCHLDASPVSFGARFPPIRLLVFSLFPSAWELGGGGGEGGYICHVCVHMCTCMYISCVVCACVFATTLPNAL